MVLLDLSAAFDTLDRYILLDRLKHTCGITDKVHRWLASYLGGRTQFKVGESLSKRKPLIMGVPQGSVLGPPLFPIHYQPVTAIVRKYSCSYHVYADDMQIYVCLKPTSPASLLDAIGRMERCIGEIQQRMTCNKLRLNSAKTELMVAVSPHHQRLVNEAQPVIRIGDSVIYPQCVCAQPWCHFRFPDDNGPMCQQHHPIGKCSPTMPWPSQTVSGRFHSSGGCQGTHFIQTWLCQLHASWYPCQVDEPSTGCTE